MLYLVRHGRTEFNAEGRLQGGLDSPLTGLGQDQARRMGRLLRTLIGDPAGWDIQTSPLGRAVHTTRIICAELGPDVTYGLDARLAEIRMGEWDGLKDEDIDLGYPGMRDGTTRHDFYFRAPGGEDYPTLAARLSDWLGAMAADPRPRIAVSHGLAGKVLRGLYAGLPVGEALRQDSPQDAVFRLSEGRIERFDCEPAA